MPSMRAAVSPSRAAAEFRLLVAQHDARAAVGRGQRRREAGGARAHHQHVAVRVALRVAVRVGERRGLAQARRRGGSAVRTAAFQAPCAAT